MKRESKMPDLPQDDFTLTTGNSFGLDCFQFDTPDNEGVLDSARLPQHRGLSDLPDGLVSVPETKSFPDGRSAAAMEGMGDIGEFLKEGSLAGLGWLNGEQDPSRLPKNPHGNVIKELEEEWKHRQTDGIHRLPYNESKPIAPTRPKVGSDDLVFVVQRAMRKSAFGEPLDDILKEAATTLGYDAPRIKQAMALLRDEHGLAGRVFIRASAFPGLHNGKWKEEIKKRCASARYVIADKESPIGAALGMKVVASVPWNEALAYYKPRLIPVGYKFASTGSAREILKAAFLMGAERKAPTHTTKPLVRQTVDTVSKAEARQAFAKAKALPQVVLERESHVEASKRAKAEQWIQHKVDAGLLSKEAAQRLVASKDDSLTLMRKAASLISLSKETKEYTGAKFVPAIQEKKATVEKVSMDNLSDWIHSLPSREHRATVRWLVAKMNEGVIGDVLDGVMAHRIASTVKNELAGRIRTLRAKHEGLAGHLYVDANAYASKVGTEGCEAGALRHRANGIPCVLAMDRCATCQCRNRILTASDGESFICQKYNKKLVTAADLGDLSVIQKRNIRMANAPDAEVTASLFANRYEQKEFHLTAATDDIELNDAPEYQDIGNIVLDGSLDWE